MTQTRIHDAFVSVISRQTPIVVIPMCHQPHCKKAQETQKQDMTDAILLGLRRVLGDGLRALRDGVLGKLTGEDESDGSLDFSRRDGGLLVVCGKLGGLSGDALEDVWKMSQN